MRPLALALAGMLALATAAPAATLTRPDFALRFDDAVWRETPSVPPALVSLDCIATSCGPKASLVVVADARPFHAPGAGAFSPGALDAAMLTMRAVALAPRARLLPVEPPRPAPIGAFAGYRARFTIETADLAHRDMAHAALRRAGDVLQIAFVGDRLDADALAHFDRLLAGFAEPGTQTPRTQKPRTQKP